MMSTTPEHTPLPYELLADYVDGLLDAPAAARVEARLETDEASRHIIAGIRAFYAEHGHDRAALDAYLDDFGRRLAGKAGRSGRRHLRAIAAAAAAVLLLLVAGWFWLRPAGPDRLVARYLEQPYPPPYTMPRADSPLDQMRRQAALSYSQGDYRTAATNLEELAEAELATDADRFLLGLAYLYLDLPMAAARSFQQAADPDLREPVQWHLALALAKAGRREEARPVLETIAATEGHYRQKEASELLSRGL